MKRSSFIIGIIWAFTNLAFPSPGLTEDALLSAGDRAAKEQEMIFRQGLDYYYAHKYSQALQKWLGPAQLGNAKAQSSIGHLYFEGFGVQQSDEKALAWYRRAAMQGEPTAQYRMGLIYLRGRALHRNPAEAYMWCSLGTEAGFPEAIYCRNDAANELSPEEMDRAERRGRSMMKGAKS